MKKKGEETAPTDEGAVVDGEQELSTETPVEAGEVPTEEEQPLSDREKMVKTITDNREEQLRQEVTESAEASEVEEPTEEEAIVEEPTEDMTTILVDGVEKSVPVSDVIESGKRTMQKDSAADLRLRQAAVREREVLQREQEVNELIAQHTEAAPTFDKKKWIEDCENALIEDEGEAAAMMAEALSKIAEHDQKLDSLSSGVQATTSYVRNSQQTEAMRLSNLFKDKYPNLAAHSRLKREANEETLIIQQAEPDLTRDEVVIKAGKVVTKRYAEMFGTGEVAAEEETPKTVKSNMPRPVRKAAARKGGPTKPVPKTRQQVIAEKQAERSPI